MMPNPSRSHWMAAPETKVGSLERVGRAGRAGTWSPRSQAHADGEAVGRGRALGPGVGQHEAARAVGHLDHAGLEAGLPEQRRLLVAQHRPRRRRRRARRRPGRGRAGGRCRSGRPRGGPRAACGRARRRARRARATRRGWPVSKSRVRLALEGSVAKVPPARPPVRFHRIQLSTVQKERSGSVGVEVEPASRRSQVALVALKYGSSTRPVASTHQGQMTGLGELGGRGGRCGGPARRWPGGGAGRCGGRRRPGSRAGW